jgi:hypothetical protein
MDKNNDDRIRGFSGSGTGPAIMMIANHTEPVPDRQQCSALPVRMYLLYLTWKVRHGT